MGYMRPISDLEKFRDDPDPEIRKSTRDAIMNIKSVRETFDD